jgi:hypothetical protein
VERIGRIVAMEDHSPRANVRRRAIDSS